MMKESSACEYQEIKDNKINWEEREKELKNYVIE